MPRLPGAVRHRGEPRGASAGSSGPRPPCARLGFRDLRVRHLDGAARVEVPLDDLPRVVELREQVVDAVRSAGYRRVTLDLDGLRSGNLNDDLP